MLSPRWRKVVRDLWLNKTRTLLVVLSIAIGVLAVGVVFHMRVIVAHDLSASYAAVNPANATLYTAAPFDEAVIQAIQQLSGVQQATGRRSLIVTFQLPGDDDSFPLELIALGDYEAIPIHKIHPERRFEPDPASWPTPAVWPPPDEALLLERSSLLVASLGLVRSQQDDLVLLEMPNGRQQEVRLAGLVYDFGRLPATNAGRAYGYLTFDTLAWLGEPPGYNELHITVSDTTPTVEEIKVVAGQVREQLEQMGLTVVRSEAYQPGKLPLDNQFQAMSAVLGALGLLSLFLSSFLVTNTISALLVQHVRQIGMMKTFGGRAGQIAAIYLTMVAAYSLLALLIAIPLATFIAYHLIGFLAYFINFQMSDFYLPWPVLLLEAGVGLLVPLLAALYPVLATTVITVREAIASDGLSGKQFGAGRLDRMVEQVQGLPRPWLLALRNTFRHDGRLLRTLITLILGGVIFMAIFSVRASLLHTLDIAMELWQFDAQIDLARPYPFETVAREIEAVPGVVAVEGWSELFSYRQRPDGSESNNIILTGLPADTRLLRPNVVQGRWLRATDENALVISTTLLQQEGDIGVGDEITLSIHGQPYRWQVVGVIETVGTMTWGYANYPSLARLTNSVGRVSSIRLVTEQHEAILQEERVRAVEERLAAAGIGVRTSQTAVALRDGATVYFNIILFFLMMMAALLAAVGGLGLMGTMSLNVIERVREIGIMRAIGASDGAVHQVFMVEGILTGLLSWLVSALLAFPLGKVLSSEVGTRFLNAPPVYSFSIPGVFIWLILILLLSALATWLPAQAAVRLSVREVLSYE